MFLIIINSFGRRKIRIVDKHNRILAKIFCRKAVGYVKILSLKNRIVYCGLKPARISSDISIPRPKVVVVVELVETSLRKSGQG
jgi:hypothetical protein